MSWTVTLYDLQIVLIKNNTKFNNTEIDHLFGDVWKMVYQSVNIII